MLNNIMLITILALGILWIYYLIKLSRINKDKAELYGGYAILGVIVKSLNIEVKIKATFFILLSLFMIYKIKKQINLLRNTNHKNN